MSGDVQPRKRKDKRRKKEGDAPASLHDLGESRDEKEEVHVQSHGHGGGDRGENIHVHHDHGIGGNICVKIIFFALLTVLLGVVGLIFIESRGSTDVDLPSIEESRFAEYFTGWLDDAPDDHGHDDHAVGSEEAEDSHGDHDEDDEHEHAPSEEAEEDDDGGHSEPEESEPAATEEEEEEEDTEEQGVIEESEEKDEAEDDDDDDDDDDEMENTAEEELDDDEETNSAEVEDEEEEEESEEEEDEEEEEKENSEDDDEDYDLTQEDESQEEEESEPAKKYSKETEEDDKHDAEDEDEDEDEDEEVEDESEEDDEENEDTKEEEEEESEEDEEKPESFLDESNEQVEEIEESEEALKEEEEAVKKEKLSLLEDNEDIEDISDVKLRRRKEKELMRKLEKLLKEQKKVDKDDDDSVDSVEQEHEETSGVAMKLGVGVALVVVAHLVVVRRWRQLTHATEEPSDGSNEEQQAVLNDKEEEAVDQPVVSRRQTLIPESADIPDNLSEDDEEDGYSEEEIIEEPIKRRTSMDIKRERENPDKYYTKEELGDSEDLDDEEEYIEEEEYLEEEEVVEEEQEEEEEDYELETSPPPSDDGDLEEDNDAQGEHVQKEPPHPVAPPRRGPQGVEADDILNDDFEPVTTDLPIERDEPASLEGSKDSAEASVTYEDDDWFFRQELDFADAQFRNKPQLALDTYNKILKKSPKLIRALVGRARALDHLAEEQHSNLVLGQAIEAYFILATEESSNLDNDTFREVAERCVNRMRFAGRNVNAAIVQQALINRFPDNVEFRNAMAVSYLLGGRAELAKKVLEETLQKWPEDGFAQVHLGFVLKTSLGMLEEGARLMEKGIRSNQSGTMDGRFLFHLGDALHRIGKGDDAMRWYELGVENNVFKSKYQRSLYNVDRLKAKPWWSLESTSYIEFFRGLEKNWEKIREEGMELLRSRDKALFQDEAESLKDTGDWKQLDLFSRGRKQPGCSRAPFTCQMISAFPPAATCSRGQAKFSVMEPGTHVWPHCGPTNCRLRAHLGLVVPDGVYLRVAEKTKSWKNGKVFVFDDSFEHEVWHNGTSVRLVLIIDVWHPDLTLKERQTLSPI